MSEASYLADTSGAEDQLDRHCWVVNGHVSAALYQGTGVENQRHQTPDKGLDVTAVSELNMPARASES